MKTEPAHVRFRTGLNRLLGLALQSGGMTLRPRDFPLWAPLVGAVTGFAWLVPPYCVFTMVEGWKAAERSGQIGWAILSVPFAPIMSLIIWSGLLPAVAVLMLLWATGMLVGNLVFGRTDRRLAGAAQGVAFGLPAIITAGIFGAKLSPGVVSDLPLGAPAVTFAALILFASAMGGSTVASIVARRRQAASFAA